MSYFSSPSAHETFSYIYRSSIEEQLRTLSIDRPTAAKSKYIATQRIVLAETVLASLIVLLEISLSGSTLIKPRLLTRITLHIVSDLTTISRSRLSLVMTELFTTYCPTSQPKTANGVKNDITIQKKENDTRFYRWQSTP